MIHQLIQPLSDIITALPYVDRYGGIVNTASRLVQVGETDAGVPIYDKEYFPVSCGVTETECWENGRYQDLIPNSDYKSIFYFEQIDGMRPDGEERKGGGKVFYRFSEKLRFVGWLNLPELGISDCNGSSTIVASLIKNLIQEWKGLTDPMRVYRLNTSFVGVEPKFQNPFEKYSYKEMSEMWLYPYDYMSILVQVDALISEACLGEYEAADPVVCAEA